MTEILTKKDKVVKAYEANGFVLQDEGLGINQMRKDYSSFYILVTGTDGDCEECEVPSKLENAITVGVYGVYSDNQDSCLDVFAYRSTTDFLSGFTFNALFEAHNKFA